jgi:hypothetical protein
MGVDTHMIAGVCACLTFTSDDSHLTIKTIPHYAGALEVQQVYDRIDPGDETHPAGRARPGTSNHRGQCLRTNITLRQPVECCLGLSRAQLRTEHR